MLGLLSYLFLLTQGDLRLLCCFFVLYRMPIWLVYLCRDPLIFPSIPFGETYTVLRKSMNETTECANSDIFANPGEGRGDHEFW